MKALILVAHPDDECIGAGIWMRRHREDEIFLVHATDGSPRDVAFAKNAGFDSREEYSVVRRGELANALALVPVPSSRCFQLGVTDQETVLSLSYLTRAALQLTKQISPDVLISPAYEGGHPDHDAMAFVAAKIKKIHPSIEHLEFPLYHADSRGNMKTGCFLDGDEEFSLHLTLEERCLKTSMFATFQSQQQVLSNFEIAVEKFRIARAYDFSRRPHAGQLLYEAWGWKVSGAPWDPRSEWGLSSPTAARK